MRAGTFLALALVACAALSSCGGEPPELLALEWRIEERPAEAGSYESLSLFASVRDYEGVDDLECLEIVNDDARLVWKLDSSNWTRQESGGDTWIGAADLAMADYGKLPRGEYRAIMTNLAGQQAVRAFSLEAGETGKGAPSLRLAGGMASMASEWQDSLILAYDASGSLIGAREAKPGSTPLKDLLGPALYAKTEHVAAYGYDAEKHRGAYSWRMKAR